jgi:hypothetical protein
VDSLPVSLDFWNPTIPGRQVRDSHGISLEIQRYLGEGEFGVTFHGSYNGEHVIVKFNLIDNKLFVRPASPYVGIEDEIAHAQLGERVRPWVARFVTSGLPLIYNGVWVSNTAMIYEYVDQVDRGSVDPFCIASQMILASKAMINQGIVHDGRYKIIENPNYLFQSRKLSISIQVLLLLPAQL